MATVAGDTPPRYEIAPDRGLGAMGKVNAHERRRRVGPATRTIG